MVEPTTLAASAPEPICVVTLFEMSAATVPAVMVPAAEPVKDPAEAPVKAPVEVPAAALLICVARLTATESETFKPRSAIVCWASATETVGCVAVVKLTSPSAPVPPIATSPPGVILPIEPRSVPVVISAPGRVDPTAPKSVAVAPADPAVVDAALEAVDDVATSTGDAVVAAPFPTAPPTIASVQALFTSNGCPKAALTASDAPPS